MEPVTILYILGSARSGSSLLASLVGELDGCFATAETRLLWHGFDDRRCGCGVPVRECPVWSAAIAYAADRAGGVDPGQLVSLQRHTTRTRHVGRIVGGRADEHQLSVEYGDALAHLYQGLSEVTGARVIVDSSKSPAEAALLGRRTDIDCRIVHLVRDARAVAYSWARAAGRDPARRRQSLVDTASRWVATNMIAERVCRAAGDGGALRIRYEDLVADANTTLASIIGLAGVSGDGLSEPTGDTPRLSRHMVGGNALRFAPERTVVRADTEWAGAMPRYASAGVTAICWPLLARYGYSLARPAGRAEAAV